MTRDWMVALASGLSLGLVSGCTRDTVPQPAVVPPVKQAVAPVAAPTPLLVAAQPLSPYRPVPTPAPYTEAVVSPASAPPPAAAKGPTQSAPNITQVKTQSEPAKDNVPQPPAGGTPAPQSTADAPLGVRVDLEPNLGDPALVHALRYLLTKRPADAIRMLKSYDQQTQDILLCVLPLAAAISEKGIKPGDPQEMAIWVDQLEAVIGPLRRQAALGLDKMCYCSGLGRYGVYQQLPPDHPFKPGDPVQIYVEVRNFSSEMHDSAYEIRLSSSVRLTRIVDGKEQMECEQAFPDRYQPDRSQSQRHDYSKTYCFTIPANLPLADYTLYLRVMDLGTTPPRVVEGSLPLRLTTRPGS